MSEEVQGKTAMHGQQGGLLCAVCGEAGAKACGRCGVDSYCGKQHQTQDWPRHKQGGCGLVALRRNPALGRHLVAARDIPAGTVIMREQPLVTWPRREACAFQQAICVGCGRQLAGAARRAQGCGGCGWPVCGPACGARPAHRLECAAFLRANFKLKDVDDTVGWDALAALRVCLAMTESPQAWRLQAMQSALPEPVTDPEDPELSTSMEFGRQILEQRLKSSLDWLAEAGVTWLDAEDLRRAQGLISVNSMTIEFREWMSCILGGASLLEHCCVANTDCPASAVMVDGATAEGGSVLHDDMEHAVVAGRDIAQGEHLTLSYRAGPFTSKTIRRRDLALRWGFCCRCVLCADPTQAGLHLESWYCGQCKGRGRQSLVRVDDGRAWRCEGCGRSGAVSDPASDEGCAQALELEQRLRTLKAAGAPPSQFRALLRDALWPRGPLHATSSVALEIKDAAAAKATDVATQQALSAAFASGAADARAEHLRELVAVIAALGHGSHSAVRFLRECRLFEHVGVALGFKLQSARQQRGRRQELKKLQQEGKDLLEALQKAAVVPFDKEKVKMHAKDFAMVSAMLDRM